MHGILAAARITAILPGCSLDTMQCTDLFSNIAGCLVPRGGRIFASSVSIPNLSFASLRQSKSFCLPTLELFISHLAEDVGTMRSQGPDRFRNVCAWSLDETLQRRSLSKVRSAHLQAKDSKPNDLPRFAACPLSTEGPAIRFGRVLRNLRQGPADLRT